MAAAKDTDSAQDADSPGCFQRGCGFFWGIFLLVVGYALLSSFSALWYAIIALVVGAVGGAVVQAYTTFSSDTSRRCRTAGLTALSLGGAALVTSLILMLPLGDTGDANYPQGESVSSTGGRVGPITIDKGQWVEVRIHQDIGRGRGSYQRWSFVTAELLDENTTYLSSFGGEHWHYRGYDGGYWREEDDTYEATLWMPAGTYYVRLKSESNVEASELGPIEIWMEPEGWLGNPRPLQWLAYVVLFLGAVLVLAFWKEDSASREGEKRDELRDDLKDRLEDD